MDRTKWIRLQVDHDNLTWQSNKASLRPSECDIYGAFNPTVAQYVHTDETYLASVLESKQRVN